MTLIFPTKLKYNRPLNGLVFQLVNEEWIINGVLNHGYIYIYAQYKGMNNICPEAIRANDKI